MDFSSNAQIKNVNRLFSLSLSSLQHSKRAGLTWMLLFFASNANEKKITNKTEKKSNEIFQQNYRRLHAKTVANDVPLKVNESEMWFTILCQKHPSHVPISKSSRNNYLQKANGILLPFVVDSSQWHNTRGICCCIMLKQFLNIRSMNGAKAVLRLSLVFLLDFPFDR